MSSVYSAQSGCGLLKWWKVISALRTMRIGLSVCLSMHEPDFWWRQKAAAGHSQSLPCAIRTDKIQLSRQIIPIFSEDHECASFILQIMVRMQQDEFVCHICEWGLIALWETLELTMRIRPNIYVKVSHITTTSGMPFLVLDLLPQVNVQNLFNVWRKFCILTYCCRPITPGQMSNQGQCQNSNVDSTEHYIA